MARARLARATARPAAGIPLHRSRTDDTTFAEQANRVLARKLTVERLRIGYLSQSTRCRFTVSHEQGTRRGRSGWTVSSKCVVWGLFAIGRIGRQPGWRDHHARNMNGGSEHLNGCSQWARVESQIIITNITWGRRALSSPQRSHGE